MTTLPENLNGWKEIAAYLGKSVRAVQRWEQDLDLPVHRVRTAAGQSVYARRDEIDAWRSQQELRPAGATEESSPAPREFADANERSSPRWSRKKTVFAVISGVLLLAAASAIRNTPLWSRNRPLSVEMLALESDSLVAREPSGRERWRYRFPHRLGDNDEPGDGPEADPARRVQVVDIDGDGTDEVLAMVRFTAPSYPSDGLFCLSKDGELRWSYQPGDTLEFDGVPYGAPWFLSDWIPSAPGQEPAVWVAVNHHLWWPSMVVKITPDGRAARVFTQSGGTYALRWWRETGRPLLLAAGINNEYESAAMAAIDPSSGAAASPQTPKSGFYCPGCPAKGPERYVVFPKSDVTVAGGFPYNRGSGTDFAGSSVRAYVEEDLEYPAAVTIYTFSKGLQPQGYAPIDLFWAHHDQLHRDGKLDHASAACPHRTASARLRVWTPSGGWSDVRIPSTAPKPGASSGSMSPDTPPQRGVKR